MNASHPAQRSTAGLEFSGAMFWLWLIGLSVIVALAIWRCAIKPDQDRLDPACSAWKRQAIGLAETIEAIQQRPAVATAS